MELCGVDLALGALHGGDGAHVGGGDHGETFGDVLHGVEVAHPHGLIGGRAREQLAAGDVQRGGAVFAHLGVVHAAAQGDGGHLMAVAKAQDRHAQLVDGRVDARRVLGVDGGRAAGQDDGCRRHLAHLVGGDVARYDFGVHVQIAHAAGDQLPVLRAEVEHGDFLAGGGRCGAHKRLLFGSYCAAPAAHAAALSLRICVFAHLTR